MVDASLHDDIIAVELEMAEAAAGPRDEGLREAAQLFLEHVAAAAGWPTPGVGCDTNCEEAHALEAAIAKASE
jgi:hypothetical protein